MSQPRNIAPSAPPPENPVQQRESIAFALLLLPVIVYFIVSLKLGRIFLYEDDLIRLTLAKYFFQQPVTLLAWGQSTAWTPGGMIMQALAQLLLPFGLKGDVLLSSLACTMASAAIIHRLARRFANGIAALLPVVLFVTSPVALWLSTGALVEPFFLAVLLAEVLFLVRYFERSHGRDLACAAAAAIVLTMIRFEGWVIGPALLGLMVAAKWRLYRKYTPVELAAAASALLFPLAWMIGSWVRYGDPLEFHRTSVHRLFPFEAIAFPQTATAGWLFCFLGFEAFLGNILRKKPISGPAALFVFGAFAITFVLLYALIIIDGVGIFSARFVYVWYGAGLPLTAFAMKRHTPAAQRVILASAIVLCGVGFFAMDRTRPDTRETQGLRALGAVEAHANTHGPAPTLRFLVPPGQLDTAQAAAFLYAPSIKDARLQETISLDGATLDADFFLIRKHLFPKTERLGGYKKLYEDSTYRAFEKE